MDRLVAKVKSSILKRGMIPKGALVCVAVSGGPDSTALLALLLKLRESLGITVKACHFDHAFRSGSERDAETARRQAKSLGVEIVFERNKNGKPQKSIQDTARRMRYGFFERLLDSGYADLIATGHTLDDCVETSVMWMLRGAGPTAFGGISAVRGKYVRPLIDVSKGEILNWLGERKIEFCEDPTNATDDYLRNRVRHHVIPAMEREAPGAVRAISRLTHLVESQGEVVDAIALEKMTGLITKPARSGGFVLDFPLLANEPVALRFSIYRAALKMAGLDIIKLQMTHVESIDNLLVKVGLGKKSVDLPGGYMARLDHDGLFLGLASETEKFPTTKFSCPLEVKVGDMALLVALCSGEAHEGAVFDIAKIADNFIFRSRIPGDFLRLKNVKGRKTLKTFLIDRKVPSGTRSAMPVLANGSEILWVPGLFLSPSIAANGCTVNTASLKWI